MSPCPPLQLGLRRLSLMLAEICADWARNEAYWLVVPLPWRSHPEAEEWWEGGGEQQRFRTPRAAAAHRLLAANPARVKTKITRLDDFSHAQAHTLYRGQPSSQRLPFSAGSPFFVVAAFPMAHLRPTRLRSSARRSVPLRPARARGVRCPTSSQRSHTVERTVRPP